MDVKLLFMKKADQWKEFPVTRSVTVVGRGEDCDLRVPLPIISRRHCEISVSEDAVRVKDLGSSNGTYVNNERTKQGELKAGDRLQIGPVIFILQIDGVPRQPKGLPAAVRAAQPAAGAAEEEVVELEADAASDDVVTALESDALQQAGRDPIAALEAMAAESDKDKEKDKKGKQR